MNTHWLSRILLLSLLLPALASASQAPADLKLGDLVASQPALAEYARAAGRRKVTFGIWGGTVRDLYHKRKFSPISDFDLIFDSSEKGFAAFREEALGITARYKGKAPSPDFHFDLNPKTRTSERQDQLHGEGITATKVGVFSSGRILDPTGLGVQDLRGRLFRFWAPVPRTRIEMHNLGRFVRDLVRLHTFRRDPSTIELMLSSMRHYSDLAGADGQRVAKAGQHIRSLAEPGKPIYFHALIRPFRRDLRYLHDGLLERLGPAFPLDIFFFDVFKSITQADDMGSMRQVFKSLEVDTLLRRAGLGLETDLIMDPQMSREELFAAFQFPGHRPAPGRRTFLQDWSETVRRYNYRVLFDMLASEFPDGAPEQTVLRNRRDAFFSKSSYDVLNPDDEYREEVVGFLDTDINAGRLSREKIEKGLDWFLQVYLPLGATSLQKIEGPAEESSPGVERGFSKEVLAIDREAPHSMKDLPGYLGFQVGRELIPLMLDPRTTHAFIDGDEALARRVLAAHGYGEHFRLNACGYSRRRRTLLGYDSDHDCVCIVQYQFHSDEQLLNEQARFWFLGGETGKRVKADNVLVLRRPPSGDFPDRAALTAWLDNLGKPVSTLIVGFTNPLKGLLERARSERIGDLSLIAGTLRGSKDGSVVLGLSGFGASFGSLPAKVAGLLTGRGLRAVAVVGTAGGLAGPKERFQWVVPARVAFVGTTREADRPAIAFENRGASLALAGALKPALHATVATPLCETRQEVQRMKGLSFASVDCELYHVVAAVASLPSRPAVFAMLNITDFPSSGGSEVPEGGITAENSPVQLQRVTEALRQTLEAVSR